MICDINVFNKSKRTNLIELKCDFCSKIFERKRANIIWRGKPSAFQFCSPLCRKNNYLFHSRQELECEQCKKRFIKRRSQMKNCAHHFCSGRCSTTYSNTHKTTGTRRSKLEVWLEIKLTQLYPDLVIHFNRKDTINSELDIYIPSLKLAFELNGIFHYEPIYGTDKLLQTKNNDQRKFQACAEKGISLCIIDTSGQKYFKETTSQKFLDIIVKIIADN